MKRAKLRFDPISGSGAVIGLVGFLTLGFITERETRIASGSGIPAFEALGGFAFVFIALYAAILLVTLFYRTSRVRNIITISLASCLFGAMIFAAGLTAAIERGADSSAVSRIAIGGGVWVMVFAVYLIIFGAYRNLKGFGVLRNVLASLPLVTLTALIVSGVLDDLAILREFSGSRNEFFTQIPAHLRIVGLSVGFGFTIGLTFGILAARVNRIESPIFAILSIIQTIPSLALFGILIAPLALLSQTVPALRAIGIRGIGDTPAVIALTLYSLLPIARNTFSGMRSVPRSAIEAGRGMGMGSRTLFLQVELPLALPLIFTGIRIALVQATGMATLAYLIGGGGLGVIVFKGLDQGAPDLIILGVIPVIALAIFADVGIDGVVTALSPKTARKESA